MSTKIRLTFEEKLELKAQQRYEEGKAEGELGAYRTNLCMILESRFGSLSDELRRRIEDSTDIAKLRVCIDGIFDIASPDELPL